MPVVTSNRDNQLCSTLTRPVPVHIVAPEIETVQVSTDTFNNGVVDAKWIPRHSILTHIEGASWIVNYYSQVLDTDSNLSGQQFTKNPVYQSYKKIINLEFKVKSPLSTTQDEVSKEMTVGGDATLYPSIIPNEGDMFTADTGQGRVGVFRITSSRKNSIFKEACYDISYVLDTDNNDKLQDLQQKTVVTYYFLKDYLLAGANPLVIKSRADTLQSLSKVLARASAHYFSRFFSNEFKTIILPSQVRPSYDAFLVDFLLRHFNSSDAKEINYIKSLSLDDDRVYKCNSIWNAISLRDDSILNTSFKRVGLVDTISFSRSPVYNGIRYSGVAYVVYPKDPYLPVDFGYVNNVKIVSKEINASSDAATAENILTRAFNFKDVATNLGDELYPVTHDDYYVLSENFYNNTQQQSTLERCVVNYITNNEVDPDQLYNAAKNYHVWGSVEQFYYLPIIMVMIKSVLRGAI